LIFLELHLFLSCAITPPLSINHPSNPSISCTQVCVVASDFQ
jgi:hypothetical protein